MSTEKHTEELERWALDADDVAQLLNVSRRHVIAMNASGRIPRPVKLGRRTVWVANELQAWLVAGAPERSLWEIIRRRGDELRLETGGEL